MNLSFCLIVRNEANTLPRLVGSLRSFMARGGEVLIMDTGSTDHTPAIARDLGCKVVEVGERFLRVIDKETAEAVNARFIVEGESPVLAEGDKLFDYAAARNHAASLAGNDWVWMPDADEIFTRLDLGAVEEAIADDSINRLEYEFVFSHDAEGKPAIRFMHSKCYRRDRLTWTGVVHEVLAQIGDKEYGAKYLPEDKVFLEHYQNHETNRTGYLRGLALDCFQNPDKDRQSHYFARELLWTGRPRSAIREFERHISMDKWPTERSQSFIFIGDAYAMLGENQKAVEAYERAYALESGRREPLMRLAEHYQKLNDHRRTLAYASAALTIPQSNFYADNAAHYKHVPYELIYWAKYWLGDLDGGRSAFFKALAYEPNSPKLLHDMRFFLDLPKVDILLPTLGREEGLKKCLLSIGNLNYPKELINVVVRGGEETVPVKMKEMAAETTGEYICFAANDMTFDPNSLIHAVYESIRSGKGLVSMDAGTPEHEHFIIRRSLLPKLEDGLIFHTDFNHVGTDNWLWAQGEKLGEATRAPLAKVTHTHFSTGAPMDATYEKGWSKAEEDRKTLEKKLATL